MFGTPVPNAPQPEVQTDNPPKTPAPRPARPKPKTKPIQFSWVPQVRGLNEQAQAMAASNARPKRPMNGNEQTDNGQPGLTPQHAAAGVAVSPPATATPPAKRAHRATREAFKYLPPGFEVGKEPIGAVRITEEGKEGTRPLVEVLYPPSAKPGTRISDNLKGNVMPNGNKCNKPSKTWTASDQSTAEDYARKHGYTKAVFSGLP